MDYQAIQNAQDARYLREYEAWIRTLPPAEKNQLRQLGLDHPLPNRTGSSSGSGRELDLSNSLLLSESPETDRVQEPASPPPPAAQSDPNTEPLINETVLDVVRRLIGEILSTPNRSLTVECLAVVSGLSYCGDSMVEIAKRHNVTRAAVSKRCVELSEKLNLAPSRAMRSLTARQSYRASQLKFRAAYES